MVHSFKNKSSRHSYFLDEFCSNFEAKRQDVGLEALLREPEFFKGDGGLYSMCDVVALYDRGFAELYELKSSVKGVGKAVKQLRSGLYLVESVLERSVVGADIVFYGRNGFSFKDVYDRL